MGSISRDEGRSRASARAAWWGTDGYATRIFLVVASAVAMILFLGIAFDTLAFGETPKSPPKSPPGSPPKSPPAETGTIVIDKRTNPGADPTVFVFTSPELGKFDLTDAAPPKSFTVVPGTYTVTETVPAGWRLTGLACDATSTLDVAKATIKVEVSANETASCTFFNAIPKESLRVKKRTEAKSGDKTEFLFEGPGKIDGAKLGDGDSVETAPAPGDYTITEAIPAGWEFDETRSKCSDGSQFAVTQPMQGKPGSASVAVTIEEGERVSCTFWNVQLGRIEVKKITEPASVSIDFADIFGEEFGFIGALTATLEHDESAGVAVRPGIHEVTETLPQPFGQYPQGWRLVDIECDDGNSTGSVAARLARFRVGPGEDVTCTFTNRARAALDVVKSTSPPSPGAPSFGFRGPGNGITGALARFRLADTQTAFDVFEVPSAGLKVRVVEDDVPSGWRDQAISCDDGTQGNLSGESVEPTLHRGQIVRCVFVNARRQVLQVGLRTAWHQVGVFDPETARWTLFLENFLPSDAVETFVYGNEGDLPVTGDWDCNGFETPGVVRNLDGSMWVYLTNELGGGVADIVFRLGNPGDQYLGGDFNDDGCDTVSIYRPDEAKVYVFNQLGRNGSGLGTANSSFFYGNVGDVAVVGDFDGDGVETFGVVRDLLFGRRHFFLRDSLDSGKADRVFGFGNIGDFNVFGDWDGDDDFTAAAYRPNPGFGTDPLYFLRNALTFGIADWGFVLDGFPSRNRPVAGRFAPLPV